MFSHFTLGMNDRAAAEAFYAAIFPVLGLRMRLSSPQSFAYGPEEDSAPWIFLTRPRDGRPAMSGNGFHLALVAKTPDKVDRFHRQALLAGGRDDGAPSLRPHYAADYYAAYVRDPVGNKLQAVCYLDGRTANRQGETISHLTLGANDLDTAGRFYESLLEPLGYVRLPSEESAGVDRAFGLPGYTLPVAYVQYPFDGRPAGSGNGQHVAFQAPTRAAVDAFHATGISLGGTDDGPPGLRPNDHPACYAADVRDPVGNKIQAVCYADAG